ncbi:hypothetical protein T01_35 [Trichinella spiralis]|uniref:Uncharacterized protein n=1 Tax=Trichinella spiralis TaxID=6334 RepID=A0A0V1AIE0_TRISP|nr:hypothetical protein T01_35 [Trichinella spiralis]
MPQFQNTVFKNATNRRTSDFKPMQRKRDEKTDQQ